MSFFSFLLIFEGNRRSGSTGRVERFEIWERNWQEAGAFGLYLKTGY